MRLNMAARRGASHSAHLRCNLTVSTSRSLETSMGLANSVCIRLMLRSGNQSVVACTIKAIGATEALRLSEVERERPTNSSCIGSKVGHPPPKANVGVAPSSRLVRVKSGRRLNCLSPPVKKPLVMGTESLFVVTAPGLDGVSCTSMAAQPTNGRSNFCPELRIGSLRVGMSSFLIRDVRPVTGARLLRRYMANGAAPMLTMWLR